MFLVALGRVGRARFWCAAEGLFHLRDGHTDAKTRADRPASQPTNQPHHIWKLGRRTGVVTGVVRASRPPIFGWEVTPDHLLCTPDHPLRNPPCTPPLACVRRTDPSPFLLFSTLSLTFDKSSKRISPSRSTRPARARFQATDALFSHLEHSSRVRSRISQGRLSVTRRLQPGKFSGRAGPDNQPTNLIGVTSRYLESPLPIHTSEARVHTSEERAG